MPTPLIKLIDSQSDARYTICLRYSYNSRTTFQLTQIVARISRW